MRTCVSSLSSTSIIGKAWLWSLEDIIQALFYFTITVLDIKSISGVEVDSRFQIFHLLNSADACERDAKIFANILMQDIFQVDEDDASRHFLNYSAE